MYSRDKDKSIKAPLLSLTQTQFADQSGCKSEWDEKQYKGRIGKHTSFTSLSFASKYEKRDLTSSMEGDA